MKTFPFPSSASEGEPCPLWRPAPGQAYYTALPDNEIAARAWYGGETDQCRHSSGLVFKSQYAAASMRRYLQALSKLWKYAALFHVENENHSWCVEPQGNKLYTCIRNEATLTPRFNSEELANIAIDRLSEAEKQHLIGGPLWT